MLPDMYRSNEEIYQLSFQDQRIRFIPGPASARPSSDRRRNHAPITTAAATERPTVSLRSGVPSSCSGGGGMGGQKGAYGANHVWSQEEE
jgi:hypothetical protein